MEEEEQLLECRRGGVVLAVRARDRQLPVWLLLLGPDGRSGVNVFYAAEKEKRALWRSTPSMSV